MSKKSRVHVARVISKQRQRKQRWERDLKPRPFPRPPGGNPK